MTDAYWFEALPKPVVLAGLSARQNFTLSGFATFSSLPGQQPSARCHSSNPDDLNIKIFNPLMMLFTHYKC